MSVSCGFDFIARLWKLEPLDEFYLTLNMFSESPLSLCFVNLVFVSQSGIEKDEPATAPLTV